MKPLALLAGLLILADVEPKAASRPSAEMPATVGLSTVQMFAAGQPESRGALVVVEVWDGTPAASSGIQNGDLIVAIDGVPVMGKDTVAAFRDQLRGPVGGTVRLSLVRPSEGVRSFEVVLKRVPSPPRSNPDFEPFSYSSPRTWRYENFAFPLPWAPKISYRGIEDILFAPQFGERSSPEYHSLVWLWWIEGRPKISGESLRATLLEYFEGLSQERGTNYHFTPDLGKVAVTAIARASGSAAARDGVEHFRGDVTTYNQEGELITLHVDIDKHVCAEANHTALLFALSPTARDAAIWMDMSSILSTFRCQRGEK
jgi:hypothetical protein